MHFDLNLYKKNPPKPLVRLDAAPRIRAPEASDGPMIARLIEDAGKLDTNSLYCNLLQCSHFADTCAIAEINGDIVGWMSGYVPPGQPDTLFVWQICVSDAARGHGLGKRLIASVLERTHCTHLRHVECTITRSNKASWALFGGVARSLDAKLTSTPHFLSDVHLDQEQETEMRVVIGPFSGRGTQRANAA